MRALIDTNIILDVALQRKPYASNSTEVLFLAEARQIIDYVSASTISDIYYIVRKSLGRASVLDFLGGLLNFCEVATVDKSVIDSALKAAMTADFKDFEDAIQNYAAVTSALDTIVTRNAKDFVQSKQRILTPEQLIQVVASNNKGA